MVAETLTPRARQELEQALLAERAQLLASLRMLDEAVRSLGESQGEEGDAGGAPADVASDLAEQAVDLSLESVERRRLVEVEDALARLAEGTYGQCLRCGGPIAVERLYALPWTAFCIDCARQLQGRGPARKPPEPPADLQPRGSSSEPEQAERRPFTR